MSKGNMLLGYARGKVGSLVFMRRNGEQVTRPYNGKPKDAATRAQVEQRSSITNIIRLYQAAPSFFNKAFEGKKPWWSYYNALVSVNLKREPKVFLPKQIADSEGGVAAPYRITQGSLQNIAVTGKGVDSVTNISLGADFEVTAATTVGELSEAILANNTFILANDQLSYLSIEQYTDNGVPKLRARKYEMIINVDDATPLNEVMPEQAVAVNGGYLAHGELVYSGAFAWVLSRNTPQGLKVSTQDLIVTSDSIYSAYVGSDAATRAVNSYGTSGDVFLDTGTSGSMATTPSNRPSVASVSINGQNLAAQSANLPVADEAIAANGLVITGSALSSVASVSVTFQGFTATDAAKNVTVAVPVTASGETQLSNTAEITLTDFDELSKVTIAYNGRTLYTWTPGGGGGDGVTEDPLA